MDNKEFSIKLEQRTKDFAISIIKISASLPNTPESKVIKNQITKSGTSIGANYREANRSRSKSDFLNKIKICVGEANETIYWLEIIEGMKWTMTDSSIINESKELLALFTSISSKLKNDR